MGKPFLNSSKDFSPLVNSFQRPSFLCTSSWLSSTLFSSLSSPLNSVQLVLTHLTSVPLVNFSQPSQTDTVANFLVLASWIAFPSDHGFNIRLCYNSRVMYYHSILLDCWLLAAAFLPRARRAVTSRAAICQERAWAAQPHKSTQAAKLSYKGTFRQRKLSTLHQAMFYTQKLLRKAALTQRSYYTEQAPKPDLDTQTEKTRFRSI